jgi:hypothetical protein
MPVREGPPEPAPLHTQKREPYPAWKARGATINLPTRAQKYIFFAGLGAVILIALAFRIFVPLH